MFSFFSFSIKRTAPSAFPVIDETKTEADDAHTIRVTWKEIAKKDQNGIILVYTVAYNVEGQPTQLSLNTTDTTTVIRGLKPYTSYCIKVRGYTKIGPSAWSPCTRVRTLQSGAVQFPKFDQFEGTIPREKIITTKQKQTNRKATGVCDKLMKRLVKAILLNLT